MDESLSSEAGHARIRTPADSILLIECVEEDLDELGTLLRIAWASSFQHIHQDFGQVPVASAPRFS